MNDSTSTAFIVYFASQKGGVTKSTLARALAWAAKCADLKVKIADLDTQQGTLVEWHRQRLDNGYEPVGSVEVFAQAKEALVHVDNYDLLVIDGAARASVATQEIAKLADLVVLPTCASLDDLKPAIKLANELRKAGIEHSKLVFALTRVSTDAEIQDAREFITESGYLVLSGALLDKAAYRQAMNRGLSVLETPYKTLNTKAKVLIDSLTDKLLGNE